MKYSARHYAEALAAALEGKSGAERKLVLARFLELIRAHGGMPHLGEILIHYEKVCLAREGKLKLEVTSAAPLSLEIRREIEAAAGKPAVLTEQVDPSVLGGLRILINDSKLIDATAKKKLEKIFS